MLPVPILRRELKAAARRRSVLVLRVVFTLILAASALVPALVLRNRASPGLPAPQERALLRESAGAALVALAVVQSLVSCFLVPQLVAGAIAEEREKGTLELLLLTRLTCGEIVLTKWAGRLSPALIPALAAWPFFVVAGWGRGLPTVTLVLVLAAGLSTSATMAALSLLAAGSRATAGAGRGAALGLVFFWLLFPPLGSFIKPGLWGGWSGLVSVARSAVSVVAPTSPLSLATDSRWNSDRSGGQLRDRLLILIGSQAALATLALAIASRHVDPREMPAPVTAYDDPCRGYRPPCQDDPIVWREYHLPTRRGVSRALIWWRHALNLLQYGRALLAQLVGAVLGIVQVVIGLAFPFALVVAAVWFAYPAVVEWWRYGDAAGAPFQARDTLLHSLRWVMGIIAGMGLLGAVTGATARIVTERDKGTWMILLTTPLSGAEILGSKMEASALGLLPLVQLFLAFGLFAVIVTGVHPLGFVVAALDFPLALWAGIVLGTRLGLRTVTTASATSSASLAPLAILIVHLPLVLGATLSGREIAMGLTREPRLGWVMILLGLIVPAATGAFAWSLRRSMIRRFDEYVDRPRRGTAPVNEVIPAPVEAHTSAPETVLRATE